MNYSNAVYLKHAGNTLDVKVSIRKVDGVYHIYMRDFEFFSFQSALQYLRHISETELAPVKAVA